MSLLFAISLLCMSPQTLTIEGTRPAAEAVVGTAAMKFIPFEVPKGVTSIEVAKEFWPGPEATVRNTVDTGLWGPGRTDYGHGDFRGWQGGAGNGFALTGELATTSTWYIPGPIPAGQWHLAQYFLKAAPEGLRYRYTVTFRFDGPKPGRVNVPPYHPQGLSTEARWYAGNLHAHSLHSDGGNSFQELADLNRKAGFDFLISTEHNTPTAHYRFAEVTTPNLLLIEGTELTTPSGHANIWGQKPGYAWDFRTEHGDGHLPTLMKEVKRQNAMFVVNHPFAPCTSCTWKFDRDEWQGANGIEVWNGAWTFEDEFAVNWWDRLLRSGEKLFAYGGTDYHRGKDPLVPYAWTYAKGLSRVAVMDALRKGHVVISHTAEGPLLDLQVGRAIPGDTTSSREVNLRVTSKEGTVYLITDLGSQAFPVQPTIQWTVPDGVKYIRAELRTGGPKTTMLALTNPIWISKGR